MASNRDLEKDLDNGTTMTGSTAHSDQNLEEGAIGEPDSDHDEVEQMDEGHLDDLVRNRVCKSTPPQPTPLTFQDGVRIHQSWEGKNTRRPSHGANNLEIEHKEQNLPDGNESYFEEQERETCACTATDVGSR